MNIFLINGSPKGQNSNSLKLSYAFINGIKCKVKEKIEIREATLSKLNIQSCKGCFSCWKSTPGKCCIQDDMVQIIENQLWADIIIFSFPLYYSNVPGILKNMIDRQLPMNLPFMSDRTDGYGNGCHEQRYDLTNKKNVLISTCGFFTSEGNYDSVISMFNHTLGKNNFETIFCGQGELFSVKELTTKTNEYLSKVEKAGKDFILGKKISEETKNQLQDLIFPKEVFERMADASWGIDKKENSQNDESRTFTKQMAALYNHKNFDGKERILEMYYTDINKTYQIILTANGSEFLENQDRQFTTRIETTFNTWQSISRGELNGMKALITGKYKVLGDISLMIKWSKFFG